MGKLSFDFCEQTSFHLHSMAYASNRIGLRRIYSAEAIFFVYRYAEKIIKQKQPRNHQIPRLLARRKRFELLTFWSVARRSIQLS